MFLNVQVNLNSKITMVLWVSIQIVFAEINIDNSMTLQRLSMKCGLHI